MCAGSFNHLCLCHVVLRCFFFFQYLLLMLLVLLRECFCSGQLGEQHPFIQQHLFKYSMTIITKNKKKKQIFSTTVDSIDFFFHNLLDFLSFFDSFFFFYFLKSCSTDLVLIDDLASYTFHVVCINFIHVKRNQIHFLTIFFF